MVKRVIFIVVWTAAFYFGSAMLVGFASGIFFSVQISLGGQVSERTTSILGLLWFIFPMIMGPLGLILGLLGKLPGTRRPSKAQDT